MKRKFTKIWSVGLVLALIGVLVLGVAPVLAPPPPPPDDLEWGVTEEGPKVEGYSLVDLAVAYDGKIYAVTGVENGATLEEAELRYSTDGGGKWSDKDLEYGSVPTAFEGMLLAVAPNDSDLVAIVDKDDDKVYYTTDGGTNFYDLGLDTATATVANVRAIAISPPQSTRQYLVVGGDDGVGGIAISSFDLKDLLGGWTAIDCTTVSTIDPPAVFVDGVSSCAALAFSPAFASDYVMVAVNEDNVTETIYFEMYSFSKEKWNNDAAFDAYVAPDHEIYSAVGATPVDSAEIALVPTYYGGDEIERVAFVSLATPDGGGNGNIYRMENEEANDLDVDKPMHSVAVTEDGRLVAGQYDDNLVWRVANALTATKITLCNSKYQRPGGEDTTAVVWSGDTVVAATQGNESACAASKDDGQTFNDISEINTTLDTIQDLYVSPDAGTIWATSGDGTGPDDVSVWRKTGKAWERVLSLEASGAEYIIRVAPEDLDTVYIAEKGGDTMYYSTVAGETKWALRICSATDLDGIQDVAVESAEVVYALDVDGDVSKTDNSGFIWDDAVETKAGAGGTIVSLGKDLLVVGGTKVYYSTDGNVKWNEVKGSLSDDPLQITATGLASGDYIYAATSDPLDPTANGKVYRAPVGKDWEDALLTGTGGAFTGIGLSGGTLYALASDGTDSTVYRTLDPMRTIGGDPAVEWSSMATVDADDVAFDTAPSALRISAGSVKLWAIDTTATEYAITTLEDVLTDDSPDATAPDSGSLQAMNAVSGEANDVAFNWNRIAKATSYEFQLALDSDFEQVLVDRYEDIPGNAAEPNAIDSTREKVVFILGPNYGEANNSDKFVYMPGTTYYWRVRVAQDGPVYSAWCATQSFTLEELAPEALIAGILAPANGTTGVSLMPSFSWTPVAGTERYEFQLASDILFGPMSTIVSTVAGKAGIAPITATNALDYNTTYLWRVRAQYPQEGEWSALANFTTMAEPVAPAPPVVQQPPVVVTQNPVPVIEMPAPVVNVQVPPPQQITIPAAQQITIPAAAQQVTTPISGGYLLAIIIIGAVLVIAVVVLIVRTRRPV